MAKSFDNMVKGVALIAKAESEKAVAKALAPLRLQIAQLEAENGALKEAIKELRQKNAEAEMTPAALKARYASLQ
jgi:regulator of replication initiation timing